MNDESFIAALLALFGLTDVSELVQSPFAVTMSGTNITHYGSSDDFQFRPWLELLGSINAPVFAMFGGEASLVGPNTRVGKQAPDGSFFKTSKRAVKIKIPPDAPFRIALDFAELPKPPAPAFVLYEGIQWSEGPVFSLEQDIYDFASGSPHLRDFQRQWLDEIAEEVNEIATRVSGGSISVHYVGHTDSTDSEESNLVLGKDRAESVENYLSNKLNLTGFSVSTLASQGELELAVSPEITEEDRADNRRVVVTVRFTEIPYVEPGEELGETIEGFRLSLLTAEGYFIDPLEWLLVVGAIEEDHPLLNGRPIAPRVCSGRVLRVTDSVPTAEFHQGRRHLENYNSLQTALSVAQPADLVLLDATQPPLAEPGQNPGDALLVRQPITIMGRPLSGGVPQTVVRANNDSSPLFQIESLDTDEDSIAIFQRLGIELIHLTLRGGKNTKGGAMQCTGISHLHVRHCHFIENTTEPVVLATDYACGGAVYILNCGPVTFSDCKFQGNQAFGGGGLAVESEVVNTDGRVVIRNCSFENNGNDYSSSLVVPSSNGGAVWCRGCHGVVITSCEFLQNRADFGGAVYIESSKSVTVHGEVSSDVDNLTGDESQWDDAFVTSTPTFSSDRYSCSFEQNRAFSAGGAILLRDVQETDLKFLFFRQNRIEQNPGCGGAIVCQSTETLTRKTRMERCIFLENDAGYGGAISLLGPFGSALAVDPSTRQKKTVEVLAVGAMPFVVPVYLARELLTDNDQDKSHDAVEGKHDDSAERLAEDDYFHDFVGERSIFHNNSATEKGGAVHATFSEAKFDHCRLSGNVGNKSGGAVAAVGKTRLRLEQCRIVDNSAEGNIPTDLLVGGGAVYAAQLYGDLMTRVSSEGSRYRRNRSESHGGAMHFSQGVIASLRGDEISGNHCFAHGGAVCCVNSSLRTSLGCEFTDNFTRAGEGGHGGAIYFACIDGNGGVVQNEESRSTGVEEDEDPFRGSRMKASNTLFTGNEADGLGGAIYFEQELPSALVGPLNGYNGKYGTIITLRYIKLDDVGFQNNFSSQSIVQASGNYTGATIVAKNLRQIRWKRDAPRRDNLRGDFEDMFRSITLEWNQGAGIYLINSNRADPRKPENHSQITYQGVSATEPLIEIITE